MRRSSRRCCWALLAVIGPAFGIEAPSKIPASSDTTTSAPSSQTVATTDAKTLAPQLVRVAHRQRFANLVVDASVIDTLSRGDVAKAVAQLSEKAETQDAASNIALIRLQRWCSRIPPRERARDVQLLEQLRNQVATDDAARLQALVDLEQDAAAVALASCQRAQFNYRGIEAQLRAAAARGEPSSVTELARIESRPAEAEKLLQTAADKNYAPAQHALAMLRLLQVQRGERTQDVATIRSLLKQAGRTSARAKLDFANCVATGCDGHPNDVGSATVFGLDAARDGERDAFTSIARMPWAGRLSMEQRLAWQYFGQRLNESGCFGEDYLPMFALLRENVAAFEKALSADLQTQARKLSDQYWQQFSPRALREQQCGADSA